MPPIVSALLAFLGSLFRSCGSLTLHVLALQYQVAVSKQTVYHPRLRPSDRLFWAWLSRLWPGWQATLNRTTEHWYTQTAAAPRWSGL
jgi:hypothetical protein